VWPPRRTCSNRRPRGAGRPCRVGTGWVRPDGRGRRRRHWSAGRCTGGGADGGRHGGPGCAGARGRVSTSERTSTRTAARTRRRDRRGRGRRGLGHPSGCTPGAGRACFQGGRDCVGEWSRVGEVRLLGGAGRSQHEATGTVRAGRPDRARHRQGSSSAWAAATMSGGLGGHHRSGGSGPPRGVVAWAATARG
jgi:hypothetical protein